MGNDVLISRTYSGVACRVEPDASLPAAFVVPGGQVVQTWETTCSLAEHIVGSHVVSYTRCIITCGIRRTRRTGRADMGNDMLICRT